MKKVQIILLFIATHFMCLAQDDEGFGAASRALGGSAVALQDAWSALNNPATLAQFSGLRAGISYRNRFLVSEMADKSAAVCFNVGESHFGVGLTSFGFSLFSRSRVSLSYAHRLGKDFFAGARVNLHHVRLGEGYGNTQVLTAELGAIYRITERMALAGQLFNPTNSRLNDYNDERLESTIRLGMRCDFSNKVFVTAEIGKPLNQKIFAGGGISYSPDEQLTFRLGANNHSFAFGVGAVFGRFLFDLSASYHTILGFTPEMSLLYNAQE